MKTTPLIVLALVTLALAGCGDGSNQKVVSEIGYGELADSTYTNDYFGLTVKVPDQWHAQDRKAIDELQNTGTEIIAGGNNSLKATLKASEQNTLTLLSVFEHEVGAPVAFNPSINIVAEKIDQFPGIKTGEDYHFHSKQLLQQTNIPYTFNKPNYDEKVGGVDFRVMQAEASMPGLKLTQRFYATRIKDYMFLIILSHINDEQAGALDDILADITLK